MALAIAWPGPFELIILSVVALVVLAVVGGAVALIVMAIRRR